jgi:hypothetical protein
VSQDDWFYMCSRRLWDPLGLFRVGIIVCYMRVCCVMAGGRGGGRCYPDLVDGAVCTTLSSYFLSHAAPVCCLLGCCLICPSSLPRCVHDSSSHLCLVCFTRTSVRWMLNILRPGQGPLPSVVPVLSSVKVLIFCLYRSSCLLAVVLHFESLLGQVSLLCYTAVAVHVTCALVSGWV